MDTNKELELLRKVAEAAKAYRDACENAPCDTDEANDEMHAAYWALVAALAAYKAGRGQKTCGDDCLRYGGPCNPHEVPPEATPEQMNCKHFQPKPAPEPAGMVVCGRLDKCGGRCGLGHGKPHNHRDSCDTPCATGGLCVPAPESQPNALDRIHALENQRISDRLHPVPAPDYEKPCHKEPDGVRAAASVRAPAPEAKKEEEVVCDDCDGGPCTDFCDEKQHQVDYDRLRAENEKLRGEVKGVECARDLANQNFVIVARERDEARAEVDRLRKSQCDYTTCSAVKERDAAMAEFARLGAEVEQWKKGCEGLNTVIRLCEDKNDNLQAEVERLKQQVASLELDLVDEQRCRIRMQKRGDDRDEQVKQLTSDLAAREERIEKLEQALDESATSLEVVSRYGTATSTVTGPCELRCWATNRALVARSALSPEQKEPGK